MAVLKSQLVVGIIPWGEVIEEFLDPLGLTLQDFANKMSGGWLFNYVAALQAAGHQALIICVSHSVTEITHLQHHSTGASIWCVPGRSAPRCKNPNLTSVQCWLRVPVKEIGTVLLAQRCNCIISQEYEYFRFDRLSRLARQIDIPIVASFQGGDYTASWLEGLVRGRSLSIASGLVVAAASERERLRRAYPQVPLRLADIPNPIDTNEWRASDRCSARQQLNLSPSEFIVINHGRIDIHRKGLDTLLEAWLRFSAEQPDVRLVIIGSGQDHDKFAQALRDSGLTNVTWLASYTTDRALVRRWLSAANVYVSASRIEGMPVAPLEAMACNLPVVAANAQGIADIFFTGEDAGGIVVEQEDSTMLAQMLQRLALDPALRDRLGEAGRRRVESGFALEPVGKALAEFLAGDGT